MLELDGEEAGGQFLRSALSLAAIGNRSVRIENVRGGRSTPGLRPQHLAVVETLAAICDADVAGAETGSETVVFEPRLGESDGISGGVIPGGSYAVDIGTAGSVSLLFDAVLPLATRLDGPLSLTATGGTDVAWSPPLDYLRYVKLPLLRQFGLQAAVEVDRRGFYPAGGGRVRLHLAPTTLSSIRLDERGPLTGVRLYSTESDSLADRDVAERQLGGALERLDVADDGETADPGVDVVERVTTTAASPSPGSAFVCRLDFENAIAGTSALGERGKPAERVGEDAADAANRLLGATSPVDRYLADQLLIWLAQAGGRVRIPAVTDHVESSLSLLAAAGYEVELGTGESDAASAGSDERTVENGHVVEATRSN